jgi:acetyl esterase/lipase
MFMSLRATVALIAASAAAVHADPVERDAFAALERPKPAVVFQYGPASSQALDVFLPSGKGPHPVAILIHGGCWRGSGVEGSSVADRGGTEHRFRTVWCRAGEPAIPMTVRGS